ncbi:carbohydrate ABC transporter permease [Corynebacterium sp. TAE3-ERU30]|uniref:carbohydrate ABC transporter permease n=1 Tax=Corynebacterium sp. TAE3-ERU30 TaxID=2849496 RepID=UPI001C4779CA|nr:carbohydrate ABC transporter permease [Corynebacterium sp. TAE3-ERU30]MBV7282255.1 carbohydrate ABC transporter permease [Corynebacterium sp. TAE3-ERU30]
MSTHTTNTTPDSATAKGPKDVKGPKGTLPDGRTYRKSKSNVALSMQPTATAKMATRITLVIVAIYFLFPVYWLVVSSTKATGDLVTTNGLLPAEPHLAENFNSLTNYGTGDFWRSILNSVLYSGGSAIIGVLVSVAAGYAIAKFRFAGRNVALVVIMGGLLMPVALLTVPLYLLFSQIGLVNTPWAIILPGAVSPFGVFLARIYAETVPDELLEAARIDGAGEFRIFFTIVLRLLAPAMVTIFLFIFVAAWNNFLLPLMMVTDPHLKPVTVVLYGMMSYFNADKGAVLLGSLMGVLPMIILFLGLQRFWQSGLSAGAVKG